MIVGPGHHQIADVDHERAWRWVDIDPFVGPIEHLEAAGRVVDQQEGVGAEIGMGAATKLARLGRPVLFRIVDRAKHGSVLVELVKEKPFVNLKCRGENSKQPVIEVFERAIEGLGRGPMPAASLGRMLSS